MKLEVKVSSKELYHTLKHVGKVVSSKTVVPALSCFKFNCWNHQLFVTGSDVETTISTSVDVHEAPAEGDFLLEHRLLMDALKELPEQPISINVDTDTFRCEIIHQSGKFNVVGQDPDDFVIVENTDETEPDKLTMQTELLVNGLKTVLPFVADNELRPTMASVFCEIKDEKLYFAASNANFLAEIVEPNVNYKDMSFLLSPKFSKIVPDLAVGEDTIHLEIGSKTIKANFGNYEVTSRLIEGNYPAYRSVIPKDNQNKALVNVTDILASLRRVTIFANKSSSLVVLKPGNSNIVVSGKDIDFSISATENVSCEYSGEEFEIGFKAQYIQQCLQAIDTGEAQIAMKNALGATLFTPVGDDVPGLTILLMPMAINA